MPKLLFLSMDWYRTKDPKVPLAMASIQAWFEANFTGELEREFKSLHINEDHFNLVDELDYIRHFNPDFLALGVYIWNEPQTQTILDFCAKHLPETKIILGGPQITFGNKNLLQEYPNADYFISGAGEKPFTVLLQNLVDGVKVNSETKSAYSIFEPADLEGKTMLHPFRCTLEELPSPYLSGALYLETNASFARWETQRGCPYKCNFCQFRQNDSKIQKFGMDRIFAELEFFHSKKVKEIAVLDPVFNLDSKRYIPILEKILELKMETWFSFQCRPEILAKPEGEHFLDLCRQYGKVTLEFGIQTFNESESQLSQRNNQYEAIEMGLKKVIEYNLDFDLHLIFGLENQTLESFIESYEKASQYNPNRLFVFPLNILKGTHLFDRAIETGYKYDIKNFNLFTESNWMTEKEVGSISKWAAEQNQIEKAVPHGCHRQRMNPLSPKLNAA